MKGCIGRMILFVIACLMLLGAAPNGTAEAGQKYTLRVSMVIAESDPLYKGYTTFAEAVGKRTNGGIQATVYPNAQLGQDEDVMEQALLGADVAFNTDAGRLGVRVKEMGIVLAPYLFNNPQEARKFLVSDLFRSWQKKLEDAHNLTLLSLNNYVGGRNFITKVPIKSPDDLRGPSHPHAGRPGMRPGDDSVAGGDPVALPWIETYPAFQQGVINGAEAQHPATYAAKLHEVGKHITLTNHILLMNGLVVGTKWFRQLPKEYQQILVEEAIKAGDLTTKAVADSEKEYEKKMAAEGATVSAVDVAPFRARAENAYKQLGFIDLKAEVNKVLGR